MYRINEHYSWYASYANAYLTNQPAERAAGGLIGPADGLNIETGVKGVWRDGTVNGALALYRINQTDLPLWDLEAPYDPSRPDCCAQSETASSYGAELEVNGELQPGWLVGAGYTYNHNEPPSLATSALASPRHLVKVWTSLPAACALARWNVGGNLEAQTDTTTRGLYVICGNNCVNHKLVQNGYAVVDLRTAFQLNPAGRSR
jgi:outer membrane receptor for ferric coprogen and ferric-rhodotorulic acid